MNRETALSV